MAAVTTAVIAGATAAYTVASSEEGKRKARAQQTEAKDTAAKREKEATTRAETEEKRSGKIKERQSKLKRQRAIASEKQGRAGTILGGAPGAGGDQANTLGGGQGKSLLGV